MMKKVVKLQYRFQISAILLLLITGIIANSFFSKKNMEHVNSSVSSIYNDRLLAASYIFNLDNALNYKKSIAAHGDQKSKATPVDLSISHLISQYDKTYLTEKEKELWQSFKTSLNQYDLSSNDPAKQAFFFNSALEHLKELSELQVKEGDILFHETVSNINVFTFTSSLEICLSIVLGIAALSLIGASKLMTSTFYQRPSLN